MIKKNKLIPVLEEKPQQEVLCNFRCEGCALREYVSIYIEADELFYTDCAVALIYAQFFGLVE